MTKVTELTMVKKLFTTKLGQGGLVMVVGSFIVGFISFLLNPIMGILLGPKGYGELLSLLSLQIIFSVPALTLNTVLIKVVAKETANNHLDKVGQLFYDINKKLIYFSVFVFLLFWLAKDLAANFLQVENSNLILLLGILTMVTFFFTASGAVLQGILKFEIYTTAALTNALLRLILGAALVKVGFSVGGALGGLILALLAAYFLAYIYLKKFLPLNFGKTNWKEISIFVGPAFLSLLGLTLLNNLDVVLVKHFFTPLEAGFYGAAVLTSRLIIFASLPITQVVFPVVTQRFEARKAFHHLVQYALGLTVLIGLGTSLIYLLFPDLVLKVFFFSRSLEYQGAQNLLAPVGLFVTFYSINTLLTYLFLSLHKVRFAPAPLLAGVFQGVVIWFYHDSLIQVVWINTFINALLAVILFGYYRNDKRKLLGAKIEE